MLIAVDEQNKPTVMRFQTRFQSIRSIVTSIIIVLGLLSMLATLITGQVYHDLTLRSQLENIERQLHVESTKAQQRLKQFNLQLSTLIVNSNEFKQALVSSSQSVIRNYLKNLQHIPFLKSGVLNLRYAYLFDDNNKQLYGIEYLDKTTQQAKDPICGKIMSTSKPTSFAQTEVVYYAMCIHNQRPYMSVRLPFMAGKRAGYLELISDVSSDLSHIEQALNFPVRLRLLDNAIIFTTDSWPGKYDKDSISSYHFMDDFGDTVLYIDALHHDDNLEKALSLAQVLVISGAVISILLAILLALSIVKKKVISPVDDVISSLRMVRDNRQHLGAQVKSRGADEIIQLMDDFNAMSSTLNQLYNTLEKMTYTDPLTRLGNRKLFHEKLEQVYQLSSDKSQSFALVLIDLDKFKQVNDTYGHQVGDKLLIEASNLFSEAIRHSHFVRSSNKTISSPVQDLLARLGGDEFAIVLPEVNEEKEVTDLVKGLIQKISQPVEIDGVEPDFGMSVGIAFYPEHADTIDELVRAADAAMYEAKKSHSGLSIYKRGK